MRFNRRHRLPNVGDIALNAGAQLRVAAQRPQLGGNVTDLLRHFLLPGPPQAVQLAAPVREGVYLRLQGVILHGQLLRRFNTIAVEIPELLLIAVQLDKLPAHGKSRLCLWAALLEGAEKIQIFVTQGLEASQLPGFVPRDVAPDPVAPSRGPPRGCFVRRFRRLGLAGADGVQTVLDRKSVV